MNTQRQAWPPDDIGRPVEPAHAACELGQDDNDDDGMDGIRGIVFACSVTALCAVVALVAAALWGM